MSRALGLAFLVWGLGGCSSSILLADPHPDGGPDAGPPPPIVEILPDPVDFGGVVVGSSSPARFVTILNPGNVPVAVILSTPSSDFKTPIETIPLLPDAGRSFPITFAPSAPGRSPGALQYTVCPFPVPAFDGGCSTQQLTLRGNGLPGG
jgi:hypothetical protein